MTRSTAVPRRQPCPELGDDEDLLDHLPVEKREQLTAIAALVQAESPALMVILFGSYARGDWVDDQDTTYRSDYDLLVIVADEADARGERSLDRALGLRAPARCPRSTLADRSRFQARQPGDPGRTVLLHRHPARLAVSLRRLHPRQAQGTEPA